MAIPFKSNVTVPNNWNLKTEQDTNLLSYNGILSVGDTGSTVQIRSGIAHFYTNNFTLGSTTQTVLKFIAGATTELGNSNIATNINGSTMKLNGGTNLYLSGATTTINASDLTFSTSNGWRINNSTGTSGQVLTSNGNASTPTWQNLPKFHFWKYNRRWIDESYPEITKWTGTADRYDIDAKLFGITNFEDKSQYQFGFVVAQISATGHFFKGGNIGVAHDITTLRAPIFFTPEMNDTKVGGNIYALNPQDNDSFASTTYNIVGEFEFYIGARTQGSTLVLDAKINFLHGPSNIVNFVIDDVTGCTLTGGFIFK